MNKALFWICSVSAAIIVLCAAVAPPTVWRNAWTTNVPARPVTGLDNLSVTNLGKGTNWKFYSIEPATVARLIDCSNIAGALTGGDAGGTNARILISNGFGSQLRLVAPALGATNLTIHSSDFWAELDMPFEVVDDAGPQMVFRIGNAAIICRADLIFSNAVGLGRLDNDKGYYYKGTNLLDLFIAKDSGNTNATRISVTYDLAPDTNYFKTMSAGSGVVLTNEGTNIVVASTGSSPTTTHGDIIVRGATSDHRLAAGYHGSVLGIISNSPTWFDPRSAYVNDAFFNTASKYAITFNTGSGGAGTYAPLNPTLIDRRGMAELTVYNTNNAALSSYRTGAGAASTNIIIGTNVYFETCLSFNQAAVTDSNTAAVGEFTNQLFHAGISSSATVSQSAIGAGAGFFFATKGIVATNFVTYTKVAGSATTNVTAWVPTTNGWYTLVISGSTNSLSFYINGTLVATHTAAENMPIGVPLLGAVGLGVSATDLSFTNRQRCYIDYVTVIER